MTDSRRVHTVVDSPVGPLTLVAEDGDLVGLWMQGQAHRPPTTTFGPRRDEPFAEVTEQLAAYFDGRLTTFSVPVRLEGTRFQRAVWQALRDVPYGTTVSYGQLAASIGYPDAVRAVGAANGRNPVPIVVPCHRVVASDGRLTGYSGGLDRKRWLLALEAGRPILPAA
ncbi:MAG TPA: methylated-DNA--[protein]-cysteine S-methyltransferase [Acidimicrobiales bacterium]|jgi:methylated-DNA-[protein]-cysteine S-methyltransferase